MCSTLFLVEHDSSFVALGPRSMSMGFEEHGYRLALVHYSSMDWIGSLAPGSCSEHVTVRDTHICLLGMTRARGFGWVHCSKDMDGFGRLCYRRLNYRRGVARRRGKKLFSCESGK
jgi:hypothetical protein